MSISRYHAVGTAIYKSPSGDEIPYLRRRLLPDVDDAIPVRLHRVVATERDRPDLIAVVELQDAELWWLLADANPVMQPNELCRQIGQVVRVPRAIGMSIGGHSDGQ